MTTQKPLTVQEFARMGGKARAEKLGEQGRKESARYAAQARWAKAKSQIQDDVKRGKKLNKELKQLAKTAEKKAAKFAAEARKKKARERKRNAD